MPGTRSEPENVLAVQAGYAAAAVLAGQYLLEMPMPCNAVLGGVQVRAATAGTGAGSTVVDVLVNGASVWTSASAKPTLAATSTGAFANLRPSTRRLRVGDVLAAQVLSVSTSGHARLGVGLAFELAQGGVQ